MFTGLDLTHLFWTAIATLIYGALGIAIFSLAFWLIARSLPFDVRKEIEEDQNLALGIVLGSVILGIAMILSAAVRG